MANFFAKIRTRLILRSKTNTEQKAIRKPLRSLKHKPRASIQRLRLNNRARVRKTNKTARQEPHLIATADVVAPPPSDGDLFELTSNVVENIQPHGPNPLICTLHDSIHPFLMRRAGGMMTSGAATTAVNRIAQFIEWAHRNLHDGNAPPLEMAASARCLFRWFMRATSKHPVVFEEYITYQTDIFQRCPSTILNHFDALQQCYNFLVHDGQLADGSRVSVHSTFYDRFPFVVKRCKRTLRAQLRRYK